MKRCKDCKWWDIRYIYGCKKHTNCPTTDLPYFEPKKLVLRAKKG